MRSLSEIVKTYFPNETLVKSDKVQLTDTWKASTGSLPLSYAKRFYLKSMYMIETDKKYYFDRRQPYLFQSSVSLFLGPLVLSGFAFVYLTSVHTPLAYSLPIVVIFFTLGTLFLSWNIKINQGLINILTIDKDWVKKVDQQENQLTLDGEILEGKSYSFISHLPKEVQDKLSFTEKFFSGVYFGGLNSLPVSATFNLNIKKV